MNHNFDLVVYDPSEAKGPQRVVTCDIDAKNDYVKVMIGETGHQHELYIERRPDATHVYLDIQANEQAVMVFRDDGLVYLHDPRGARVGRNGWQCRIFEPPTMRPLATNSERCLEEGHESSVTSSETESAYLNLDDEIETLGRQARELFPHFNGSQVDEAVRWILARLEAKLGQLDNESGLYEQIMAGLT